MSPEVFLYCSIFFNQLMDSSYDVQWGVNLIEELILTPSNLLLVPMQKFKNTLFFFPLILAPTSSHPFFLFPSFFSFFPFTLSLLPPFLLFSLPSLLHESFLLLGFLFPLLATQRNCTICTT